MSEIRYDRLFDRHVIIAPERLHRPTNQSNRVERRASQRVCPFCEGNEQLTPPEIYALRESESFANEAGWKTRVVPNLFKALQIEAPYRHNYSFFEHWDGFGAHEILIDTPQHYTSMTQWSEEAVINWLKTLRQRFNDLKQDTRIVSLSLFKNEGVEAGGTQPHSHTQVIAMPIMPKAKRQQYEHLFNYYKEYNSSLLATMIQNELEDEAKRIVSANEKFTAFCPYASSYPFEVIISSQQALGELGDFKDENIKLLATILLDVLHRLKKQLGTLEFNLMLSTPPLHANTLGAELFHALHASSRFYIRIAPRIYKYGGFEHESEVYINPLAPEMAAKLLRESDYV
ncbi:MAG: UTP--glucose-1-phosphate uridylyltransferase [Campylobacterales bacterium]|nr:UTP--glucose-1-phosphate uridylyltransferase [Campylobacterales bacterium]